MEKKRPTFGHGKICYVEIPAVNIDESAAFYQDLFGWTIRKRGDGSVSFDDSVMQVSGSWVLNRKPYTETGMVVSIMVDDAAATLERIVAKGGKVIQPIGMDLPAVTAHFSDPAGNIWAIYQHGG
jgi:uncharacterized protein